jgi:hypothetical protein
MSDLKINYTNLAKKVDFAWSILAVAASVGNKESKALYLKHVRRLVQECCKLRSSALRFYNHEVCRLRDTDPQEAGVAEVYLIRCDAAEQEIKKIRTHRQVLEQRSSVS